MNNNTIIELNDKIKINKNANSIFYKSFNDKEYVEVNSKNIDSYGKIVMVLKTKQIKNFPIIFTLYSNNELIDIAEKSSKQINNINLFDIITFDKEKETYQILEENKNLESLFDLIDKKRLQELDLLSHKKWVCGEKHIYDEEIPFIFYKKEHFNLLKSFDEKIVSFLIKNNFKFKVENENVNIDKYKLNFKIVQFLRVISLFKQQLFSLSIEEMYKVIFILYSSFDVTDVSEIEDEEKDIFVENLKYLYKIFYDDIIFNHNNNNNNNNNKDSILNRFDDLEFINSKISFYSKMFKIYSISYINSKRYKEESLRNLYKHKPELTTLYSVLSEIETKSKIIINENISVLFLENNDLFLIKDAIILDEYLFIPLSKNSMFEYESLYMNNCMRSKANLCKINNICNNGNFNLFFHVIKFNSNINDHAKNIMLENLKNNENIIIKKFSNGFKDVIEREFSYQISSNNFKPNYCKDNKINYIRALVEDDNFKFNFLEVKLKSNNIVSEESDKIMFTKKFINYINNIKFDINSIINDTVKIKVS